MKVKAVFMDCDGVLSTGSYFYTGDGKFLKEFSCIDGKGFAKARAEGIQLLVITEEPHEDGFSISKKRCEDQGIELVRAKSAEDKLSIVRKYLDKWKADISEAAFVSDDVGDVHVLEKIGLPIAVSNATDEVKDLVKRRGGYITKRSGGKGAVREAIEWILQKNKK